MAPTITEQVSILLEEKVLYRTLKGSISATFGTTKRFYTLFKKWFLWVLYRILGFFILGQ